MSVDVGFAEDFRNAATSSERYESLDVATSYDGSNVVLRLLRLGTWGPALMNLGYHQFCGPFAFLNALTNLETAQQRLVFKSLLLLKIQGRHNVLDIACGRGKSTFMVHALNPEAQVVGLDFLDCNVQIARTLYAQIGNLSYTIGNAMALDFPDGSFDRVMCLEAAFHFHDRALFLREAARVLRPGGRLLVVDFAWNTDADRSHRDDPETRLVRDVWQWDDIYSIPEYQNVAVASGFRVVSRNDWTRQVTSPIQSVFECVSSLGNRHWGRQFLQWSNPLYRSFSAEDWRDIAHAVRAHRHVRRHSKYMAFVFEKR